MQNKMNYGQKRVPMSREIRVGDGSTIDSSHRKVLLYYAHNPCRHHSFFNFNISETRHISCHISCHIWYAIQSMVSAAGINATFPVTSINQCRKHFMLLYRTVVTANIQHYCVYNDLLARSAVCSCWRKKSIHSNPKSYSILPGQNKMSKTENENRFERCWNHHFHLGFVHIYWTFYSVLVILLQT